MDNIKYLGERKISPSKIVMPVVLKLSPHLTANRKPKKIKTNFSFDPGDFFLCDFASKSRYGAESSSRQHKWWLCRTERSSKHDYFLVLENKFFFSFFLFGLPIVCRKKNIVRWKSSDNECHQCQFSFVDSPTRGELYFCDWVNIIKCWTLVTKSWTCSIIGKKSWNLVSWIPRKRRSPNYHTFEIFFGADENKGYLITLLDDQ